LRAYAIYGGNSACQQRGANKLLYWEAIRLFRNLGVQRFDFVGTRINPEKGSKAETLGLFKKRFGAVLKQGYLWKYSFHPLKYRLYHLAARLRSRGDIVDAEKHKLVSFKLPERE
jgi:lipid II:glycine glycyltransferase (peptidoglycan interpeptide bridge formation enzyme)